MADFLMDPLMAKMVIASVELGCSEEILFFVLSNLSFTKQRQARPSQISSTGDHLTLLTVHIGWKAANFSNPWCYEIFIQVRSMRRAQDMMKQLLGIMDR